MAAIAMKEDNDIRQNDKRRSNETKEWKQCRSAIPTCKTSRGGREIGGGPADFPPGPHDQHQPACKPGSVGKGDALA